MFKLKLPIKNLFRKRDALVENVAETMQKLKKSKPATKSNKKTYEQLNAVEKIQFNVTKEHYRKNQELSSLDDSQIEELIDTDDFGVFITNKDVHDKFLHKINDIFQTEIISDTDELEKKYDLQDFYNIESAYSARSDNELPQELRGNKKALSDRYLLCEKHLMLPLIDKDTGKKILAVSKPTIHIKDIYHDKMVLITIDIISRYYRIAGLEFLENNETDDVKKTPIDLASRLLQYMVDEKLSDLQLYLHSANTYGVLVRKNGELKSIATRISLPTGQKVTEALLRMMQEEPKTTKPQVTKKLTFHSKTGIRQFRTEMIDQSKTGIVSLQKYKATDIRLLGDNSFIKDITNLGYGKDLIKVVTNAVRNSHGGLYLIAGATNSGKTTTLYAILYDLYAHLKSIGQTKKILTIDSPLEYDVDGFISVDIQDSIDNEKPLTTAQVIRSYLRKDPDICAVTEMRSKEDFEAFMEMGLRGHPTFGTLHTNSAKGTILFLEEQVNISKLQLRENIKLILHVDLVKKNCPMCHDHTPEERKICPKCGGSGHFGVVPIYEMAYFIQKGGKQSGFDANYDDIYDFETLSAQNKMIWIKKEDVAKRLFLSHQIPKETYMKFSGEAERQILTLNDKESHQEEVD